MINQQVKKKPNVSKTIDNAECSIILTGGVNLFILIYLLI
jgi:hypothetical protein